MKLVPSLLLVAFMEGWTSIYSFTVKPKFTLRTFGNAPTTALQNSNGDNTDLLPLFLKPFDCNGDGKLDHKDMELFQSNLVNALDLNGDGELNEKDVIRAIQLVTLSWLLTLSPAAAKGGGHGGGGHGGGGHSSSHGGSYSTVESYPPYRRYWYGRNGRYDQPWNPNACFDMPGEGEQVDTLTFPGFLGIYKTGVVERADETTCNFEVGFSEGRATKLLHTQQNWVALLPAYAIVCYLGVVSLLTLGNKMQDDWFDAAFERELGDLSFVPTSGSYTGFTKESDSSSQAVNVQLHFDEETGEVQGSGYDSMDGKYTLDGEWAGNKVKWIESYNEGFTVAVRGKVWNGGTKMDCSFVSSRGIRGSFNISRKKGWIFPERE